MQKRIAIIGTTIGALLLSATTVFALPPLQTATLTTLGTTRTLTLPPSADNSNVISLGTAVDPGTGKVVEGYAIIHRKDGAAKPGSAGAKTQTCYTYLSKGAKWRTTEPWIVNPVNIRSLDPTAIFNLVSNGISKWEDATDGVVGNGSGVDVLGAGSITSLALVADTSAPDNQNEVYFADIANSNAIAVTIVWGIFGGPVWGRELVEWDQIYDDVTFDWSAESSGVAGKMDFDNIVTHELGHSVGMGDLYNACVEETMYGYSANSETKKRDLNSGDITGVNGLY